MRASVSMEDSRLRRVRRLIKPLIKPGDYGGVRVLTTYPFPDSCKVSKLFGQAFAIEFVWKSIARRHQRPRELPVTRMTDLKRRVFHTGSQPIMHQDPVQAHSSSNLQIGSRRRKTETGHSGESRDNPEVLRLKSV